eukprot:1041044-Amorphochlora_amoeboformis.AAC.2
MVGRGGWSALPFALLTALALLLLRRGTSPGHPTLTARLRRRRNGALGLFGGGHLGSKAEHEDDVAYASASQKTSRGPYVIGVT